MRQLLAGTGDPSESELDVWARLQAALGKRPVKLVGGKAEANTALGFVAGRVSEKDYAMVDALGRVAKELGSTIPRVALAWVQARAAMDVA